MRTVNGPFFLMPEVLSVAFRSLICYTNPEVIIMKTYPLYIVDAFADAPFSGNPAGVVLLGCDGFPDEKLCIKVAAELKHSETAFVREVGENEFEIRYCTPVCEAALCGHATVAAFTVLRDSGAAAPGDKLVHTTAGDITVTVEENAVWLDMAEARLVRYLDDNECEELYTAYGMEFESGLALRPAIVSVGLADVMMPVGSEMELNAAVQDDAAVTELSRRLGVTGVHMFALGRKGATAACRNFAPLYGIKEECATGTSNGALYHYLALNGVIIAGSAASFLQGEAMGRPSTVLARSKAGRVRVGGPGAIVIKGELCLG